MLKLGPPVARTPLHDWHAAHGARFMDQDGWQVVAAYMQAEGEARAARAGLGLADITSLAQGNSDLMHGIPGHAAFWLLGPRLEEILSRLRHLSLRCVTLSPDMVGEGRVKPASCIATGFAGVESQLVFPAEPSLPSLQIHVGWDVAEYVWERILAVGGEWKIVPLGLEALQLLGALPGRE